MEGWQAQASIIVASVLLGFPTSSITLQTKLVGFNEMNKEIRAKLKKLQHHKVHSILFSPFSIIQNCIL
jgi:hypothetical protein